MLNYGKPPSWAETAESNADAVLPGTFVLTIHGTGAAARAL
jgi:hypothetical protein